MNSTTLAKVGMAFNRGFSKSGLPLLRISQEEGVSPVARGSEGWVAKSAILLTLLGASVSLFSTQKLHDDRLKSFRKK